MIKQDQLDINHIYEVDGLHMRIAVWDGEKFIGPKLDNNVVTPNEEYHYLEGLPRGTVRPVRKLDMPSVIINHSLLVGLAAAQDIILDREC